MTEISGQRPVVRNRRADVMSGAAECAERFLCALFATVVKPISDLRLLISALCALLFSLCLPAQAQQPKKVPRIGFLSVLDPASESSRSEALGLALRELGYIEGQNISTEFRYTEGKPGRNQELATELVRLKVDIIVVAGGSPLIRAAKNATKAIPIVIVGCRRCTTAEKL
jgi:putative tryptophan/tyrosine transport system substrate-binding protein